jgi:peroxiredoxin
MTAAGHRLSRARRPRRRPSARNPKASNRPSTRRPSARRRATTRQAARWRSPRRRAAALWSAAVLVLGGVITAAALTTGSGSLQRSTARPAPGFTLTDTSGKPVSLASYRGHDVVLYFSEGAGCDACFYQMREFEQHTAELGRARITILPIVMNPASQIRPELASFGLRTPYLIDTTGSVSRAYGVLGKGMHAGLPGHGFVLIDTHGTERWYGEYPSMYLSTAGLLQQVRTHLSK